MKSVKFLHQLLNCRLLEHSPPWVTFIQSREGYRNIHALRLSKYCHLAVLCCILYPMLNCFFSLSSQRTLSLPLFYYMQRSTLFPTSARTCKDLGCDSLIHAKGTIYRESFVIAATLVIAAAVTVNSKHPPYTSFQPPMTTSPIFNDNTNIWYTRFC
jgi:hypothetical protein